MRWWTLFGTAVTLGVSLCMFILFKHDTLDFHDVLSNPDNRAKATLLYRADEADLGTPTGSVRASNDWVGPLPLDPALQHRLLPRRRRHQHGAGPADDRALLPGR